jgi:hypothetical protein
LKVWPNPFDPKYAVGGFLKAYQVPAEATMSIYTVSGELVVDKLRERPSGSGWIIWDGKNKYYAPVSSGIYYYVILDKGGSVLLKDKLLVIMSEKPPDQPFGAFTK